MTSSFRDLCNIKHILVIPALRRLGSVDVTAVDKHPLLPNAIEIWRGVYSVY